jgi:hypothetical protein
MRWAGALSLAVLAAATASSAAQAASCCASSSAADLGRLAPDEHLALGAALAYSPALGRWDEAGRWRPFERYADVLLRTTLWGNARLGRRLLAGVQVPLVAQARSAGELREQSLGPGDVAGGLRYEPVEVGEREAWPGVSVSASASAPTGRTTANSRTLLGSDVFGRGAWVLNGRLGLEQSVAPWFVRGEVALAFPLPMRVESPSPTWRRFGPGGEVGLQVGRELARSWLLSVGPWLRYESARVDGAARVEGSESKEALVEAQLTWRATRRWTAQLTAGSGLLQDALGQNREGRWTASLGVRRGFH